MANRQNISISVTPEQAAFLVGCVETGRYQTLSEVVREAVRLLEDREASRLAGIERARQLLQEGARQLDAGEELDSETVFRDLRERRHRDEQRPSSSR